MAAVEVTITGTLYDKLNRTTQQVVLIGDASLTGLGVGGGPMPPGPGRPPVGIWPNPPEGIAPHPEHPIVKPGDPSWGDPHPAHPIVIPVPPIDPPPGTQPDDDGFIKAPPPNGGWAYHETYGWGLYPKPGQAGPKQ